MNQIQSIRRRIFRVFTLFVILVALAAVSALVISTRYASKKELAYDIEALEMVCDDMEKRLDENLDSPYKITSIYSRLPEDNNGFMYIVFDKDTGEALAPEAVEPALCHLEYPEDDNYFEFRKDGMKFFGLYKDMDHHNQRVVFVSSFKYAFGLVKRTEQVFLHLLFVILAAVLLFTWKVILPSAEETIRKKNKAELELDGAGNLQKMAVTQVFPEGPEFSVHGFLKPAREVGGDLYGCMRTGDDLYFVIGDVSDKGAPAAFIMFLLSSIVHPMFKEGTPVLNQVERLNSILCENPNYDMFCTGILGKVNISTRQMQFVNAGHTRMLLNGKLIDASRNMPLGVIPDYQYVMDNMTLAEGSTLILYTDGVTEERSPKKEFFGEERLVSWWKEKGQQLDVKGICCSLEQEVEKWQGATEQSDDRAILAIKLNNI